MERRIQSSQISNANEWPVLSSVRSWRQTTALFILKIGNHIMKNWKLHDEKRVVFDPYSDYLPRYWPPLLTKEHSSRNMTRKATLSGLSTTANGSFCLLETA